MATRPRRVLAEPAQVLEVIRGRGPKRSALVPAAIVLILAVFAVAGIQAYVGQEGLRAARLEKEVKAAEERYSLLRARLAETSSPQRIEHAASEQGMVPPPDPVFLQAPGPVGTGDDTGGRPARVKRLLAGER